MEEQLVVQLIVALLGLAGLLVGFQCAVRLYVESGCHSEEEEEDDK